MGVAVSETLLGLRFASSVDEIIPKVFIYVYAHLHHPTSYDVLLESL